MDRQPLDTTTTILPAPLVSDVGPAWRRRLFGTKLEIPQRRPGLVARGRLIRPLLEATGDLLAVITAPAGYGKTTLVTEWARVDPRPTAWLTLDARDDDPLVLVRYITAAIERVHPLPDDLLADLDSVGDLWSGALPQLCAALRDLPSPLLLAFDDAHLLRGRESVDVILMIARHLPSGSAMVLAGRDDRAYRLARWRIDRLHVMRLDASTLAMDDHEAAELVGGIAGSVPASVSTAVNARCEGWAAGLYLASLGGGDRMRADLGTDPWTWSTDRLVADYVREEVLERLSRDDLRFLTRTSILGQLDGPACDAMIADTLGTPPRSEARLERLARTNLFVVPLPTTPPTYRYHHLFRDLLRGELRIREPELIPALAARAAAHLMTHGGAPDAIELLHEVGDESGCAALVSATVQEAFNRGEHVTVLRWLSWFQEPHVARRYPLIAVQAAWWCGLSGHSAVADRWADLARSCTWEGPLPDGTPSFRPWLDLMLAAVAQEGLAAMEAHAHSAAAGIPPASPWYLAALSAPGIVAYLRGDRELARTSLSVAMTALAAHPGSVTAAANTLGHLAMIAIDEDRWDVAAGHVTHARSVLDGARMGGSAMGMLISALEARLALRAGDRGAARVSFARGLRGRHQLGWTFPWASIPVRYQLAVASLRLGETDTARTLLAEIDEIRTHRPRTPILVEETARLRMRIEPRTTDQDGPERLTDAEWRVLTLLATHRSLPEIAEHLSVSRNTVKTQVRSIYQKLDVGSRAEAVDRATAAGLLTRMDLDLPLPNGPDPRLAPSR
jgi:LuxR family maltose regulon positive regulatory protein